MRTSKIGARLLSVVLAVMMLFSLVTVGFSASAATVDTAETGATITGGQTFYLKPNSNWTQANARFAIYLCNGSSAATWVSMTQVDDASAVVYEATVPAGQSHATVIFCRMNPANNTNNWDNKWNQSSDLTWNGTTNCYAVKAGTWDKGGGTWSTYTAPAPAQPGDASGYYLMGTITDWVTGQNMVYAADTGVVTTTVEAEAGSYALKVKNGDNWMGAAELTLPTSIEGGTIDATDVDGNVALTLDGGTYTFNFTVASKALAIEYKAPEGGDDTPVVPTFVIPWAKSTGLYAYAAVTETVGTDAWQLWKSVSGKAYNYFFLPASASDTEVIIYNNYNSAVTVNGVEIAAKDYATVPYTNGAELATSGATSKAVKVMKSDAEGTLYINSKDGMETKNDAGEKAKNLSATYDVYSFLTSGTKNQEASKLAGAVADETGVTEGTTVKKIKGRGNSTWNLSKKPFNITYDESIQIDGIAKGKKWSLLANAQDSSLLRNRLVYDLANEANMHYACDSRFVDFIVNGVYLGSYQLTQKIEMGKNTVMPDLEEPIVEVEEEGDVVPTENFDFILELDTATNAASAGDMTFPTTRGQVMTHKTPDEPTAEQVAFMKAKYQAVEDALYGGDLATLATLVDINDFARAYLVNEVAKNLDSGVTSCYFVYDSDAGIFYMSPVWDYDNALGNSVSIAERHDASGNMLDLTQPSGWYARDLMHFDADFKGGKSVFAQACALTSTVDGKTFMDIVKEVWAADFADAADILAGEATAENGRLLSADGYLASLAQSGSWNYSYAGWQLSNATNNTWISNHSNLKMYVCDDETKTYTYEMKKYDQTSLTGQATYAADWMASRIEWMDAQYNEYTFVEPVIEIPDAPAGYITVFFENNWAWPDAKIYFWGSKTVDDPQWPGVALTNYYKTTDAGYDVYYYFVPADVTGMLFNGTGGYGEDQSADVTDIKDGNCYYMTWDEKTQTKPCGIYTIDYKGGNEEPTEPVPTTPDPTTPDPTTPDPTTPDPTDPKPTVPVGTKTVYFSNSWFWAEPIYVYSYYDGQDGDPAWPGAEMTYYTTNDFGEDIYSAVVPADVDFIIFSGTGGQTPDIPGSAIPDGWGAYPSDVDPFYGTYEVAPSEEPTTVPGPTVPEEPTTAPQPTVPGTATTIYLKVNNDWPAADAWFAAYYWNAAGEYGWATMTATEDAGIYTAAVPADTTGLIFTRRNPATTELGWNKDGETKKIWNQTTDIDMTTDLTKNMFVLDGGWNDLSGTWSVYDVNATAPTAPNVAEDTVIYFTNSQGWNVVNLYTWGGAGASKAWPGNAMTLVGKNTYGQDIYTAVIPAGTEGFLFNGVVTGTFEGNKFQTVDGDITKVVENAGFYPSEQVKTEGDADIEKWLLGEFTYTEGTATPDEPVATTDEVLFIADFNEWKGVKMTADGDIYTVSGIELKAGTYEFVLNAFGKWLGNSGTIKDATEGAGWTFAEGKGNVKLAATGGVYTITFDAKTNKVTVSAEYAVKFNEGNFTVTAPATVKNGENLTFTVEAAEGYKVSAVIVDMAILEAVDGVYTIEAVKSAVNVLVITSEVVSEPAVMEFTVTFTDKDGNELSVQTVKYGEAAVAPEAPVVEGYEFKAWDTAFDYVTKDITVKATYKKIAAPVVPSTTGTIKVDIAGGNGFSISIEGGAARPQGVSYINTKAPKGANVTVTANTVENAAFVGWVNPITGVVLTTDYAYSFVASGNDFIKAMYTVAIEGVQVVNFKNDKANQILDSQYYASTDAIQFPNDPTQVGFDFTGWNMTEAEIQAAIAAGQDVTVLATWTRTIVKVNITVTNGSGSGVYNALAQVTATANAAPAGQKFAYWTDAEGNVKSYSQAYKFFPTADTEVIAVFVAEDAVVEEQILVSMDTIDTTGEKNVFYYTWYVPSTYTFVKAGIVAVNKDNYNEATLVAGSSDSNVYDRSPSGANMKPANSWSWSKSNVPVGQTWVAKAYVQYRDADGTVVTVYSDIMEATRE